MTIQAKARVQITVEVDAGSWGNDCPIGQLYKQAAESGKINLLNALKPGHAIIIGEPKVISIITENS